MRPVLFATAVLFPSLLLWGVVFGNPELAGTSVGGQGAALYVKNSKRFWPSGVSAMRTLFSA